MASIEVAFSCESRLLLYEACLNYPMIYLSIFSWAMCSFHSFHTIWSWIIDYISAIRCQYYTFIKIQEFYVKDVGLETYNRYRLFGPYDKKSILSINLYS
jgi:hypothetical protein